jgi:hypothetical protein
MGQAKRMQDLGFKMNPRTTQNQQQPITIDITNATQQQCSCGCKFFQPVIALFKVSAIVSPTGQELMAQQPAIVCAKCGEQFTGESKIIEG